jgi:hypothetical protein
MYELYSRFGAVGVPPMAQGKAMKACFLHRMLSWNHPSVAQDHNQMVGKLPLCYESTTMSLLWIGPRRFARPALSGLWPCNF